MRTAMVFQLQVCARFAVKWIDAVRLKGKSEHHVQQSFVEQGTTNKPEHSALEFEPDSKQFASTNVKSTFIPFIMIVFLFVLIRTHVVER